jgi:hypothetical protein
MAMQLMDTRACLRMCSLAGHALLVHLLQGETAKGKEATAQLAPRCCDAEPWTADTCLVLPLPQQLCHM